MYNRSDLYRQHLLDLAKNPRNYGLIKDADFVSQELNPSCGDSVTICGSIEDNKLKNVRFEGSGCVLSLAMASLLTDYVSGLSVQETLSLDEQIVEKLLQMPLGINRLQCGMLSVFAVKQGVLKYKSSIEL